MAEDLLLVAFAFAFTFDFAFAFACHSDRSEDPRICICRAFALPLPLQVPAVILNAVKDPEEAQPATTLRTFQPCLCYGKATVQRCD
jgi:hypothetical protein